MSVDGRCVQYIMNTSFKNFSCPELCYLTRLLNVEKSSRLGIRTIGEW